MANTKITKKAFRAFLNEQFKDDPNHRNNRFQQRTRGYGDYLYFQDREKFNAEYEEHLEQLAVAGLKDAVAFVEKNYPLPRCTHGNALKDHAGDVLEPSCGCKTAVAAPA